MTGTKVLIGEAALAAALLIAAIVFGASVMGELGRRAVESGIIS